MESPKTTLHIGNLPFSVGWQDLKDLFRSVGNVVRADVALTPQGKSRGFGSITYSTTEEAQNAINSFNQHEWNGRQIDVRFDKFSQDQRQPLPNRQQISNREPRGDNDLDQAPSSGNGNALYVGNLPYSVGWQDLKDLFREAGTVSRADVPQDHSGRSRGFGIVVMETAEEAQNAITVYNGHDWNGRTIEVREDKNAGEGGGQQQQRQNNNSFQPREPRAPREPREPREKKEFEKVEGGGPGTTLYVGNLPFNVQWQELKDFFREQGSVVRADVALDGQGRSRGYGQVVMSTPEQAQSAIQNLNGHDYNGRTIEVREDKYVGEAASQIFVGNIPFSTRWQELKDIFRSFGLNPTHADILLDNQGRSKGCGTVRFETAAEAEKAVTECNGSVLEGRNLMVKLDKFV